MFIIDTCLSHRPHSGWSSTLWKRANFGLKTLMFRRPFSTQSIKKYQKVPSARLGDLGVSIIIYNHETKSWARFTANSNKIVNQQMPHLVWWTAPKVQRSKFHKPQVLHHVSSLCQFGSHLLFLQPSCSGSAIKRYGRELLFAVHAQNVTF